MNKTLTSIINVCRYDSNVSSIVKQISRNPSPCAIVEKQASSPATSKTVSTSGYEDFVREIENWLKTIRTNVFWFLSR